MVASGVSPVAASYCARGSSLSFLALRLILTMICSITASRCSSASARASSSKRASKDIFGLTTIGFISVISWR